MEKLEEISMREWRQKENRMSQKDEKIVHEETSDMKDISPG